MKIEYLIQNITRVKKKFTRNMKAVFEITSAILKILICFHIPVLMILFRPGLVGALNAKI